MKNKKLTLILIIGLVIFVLLGCASETIIPAGVDIDAQPIRIGVIEPLTGASKEQGLLEKEGIKLAHELYPTVLNQPIELVCVDSQSDIIKATEITEELLTKEEISVVIGSFGSLLSMASGPECQKMKVPAIGSTCTNPLVTLGNPYYFRVCETDLLQGDIMAEYAFSELQLSKVAVIKDELDNNSVALAQVLKDKFVKLSQDEGSVVYDGSYSLGEKNYQSQIEALKKSEAEAVFIPMNIEDSARIIKEIKKQEIDIQVIGASWWETPEMIELAKEDLEGIVFCNFRDFSSLRTKRTDELYEAYRAKFGNDAEPAIETILAFDAYLLAIDAIERAQNIEGEYIQKALVQTEYFVGASGTFKIDENGDVIKSAVIKTVENQRFINKMIQDIKTPVSEDKDAENIDM